MKEKMTFTTIFTDNTFRLLEIFFLLNDKVSPVLVKLMRSVMF